jgi:hypothetical protein
MGEAKQKKSSTQKFIAQHPWCCFCGGTRAAVTREHMPPKSLFDNSHRPDKLVMPACDECNRGTSTADLVAAIVSRWNYNSNEAELSDHQRLVRRVRTHHPNIFEEWTSPLDRAKARQHLLEHGVSVPVDAGLITVGENTIRQLNIFAHKVVLGLYFNQAKDLLTDEGRISALWRSKEDFAKGVPPELLDMMQQYGTPEQGKWSAHETFEYRFAENKADGLFMCLARFRGGLYTAGFAAQNAAQLPQDDLDWIKPSSLLGMIASPQFAKKL